MALFKPLPQNLLLAQPIRHVKGLVYGLALLLGCGAASPGLAAERLTVRLGPIEQSVTVSDLEEFAATGDIPPSLSLYAPLLTEDVRQALNSRIQLDPEVGDRLVDDLLQSSAGRRLLSTLEVAIPNSTVEDLEAALTVAAQQVDGLSLLGFLRAYPEETVVVDGSSAIALASQMNLPYWQSQALSTVLERELTVQTEPFQPPFDPTVGGDYWVRQQTLTFHDYERSRTIPVDLYWNRDATGPLVIMSHGFGADRRFMGYLARHLASHGIVVAALEHPGSNVAWLTGLTMGEMGSGNLADILPPGEFIDRPLDVSFLLDELARLNRYSPLLRGRLNTDQVTIIGHSLGGYTALALAGAELDLEHLQQFCDGRSPVGLSPADWLQCTAADLDAGSQTDFEDPRIAQIIALNPVMGRMFDESSLTEITVPTLILTGTDDSITPAVSQQILPFAQIQSPKYLLTAIGGTHLSIGDPENLNHALTESLFVRERRGDETEPLRQLLRGLSLAFVKQMTPEAERYRPFLSPAYVQSFSTTDLRLRFNTQLPENLSNWLKMAALPLEQLVAATLPKNHEHAYIETGCNSSVGCLFIRLPLVMFILPRDLPLAGSQLFRLGRRSSTRRVRKIDKR
ncbi:MAG: alpha/beta hydrolase [Leptolyngbyaceae cyanobacterium RM1_406_9]|nr:alpha/beta hydrolase [Leptolyngbyaceae cyanobacterium RM1_406_9]